MSCNSSCQKKSLITGQIKRTLKLSNEKLYNILTSKRLEKHLLKIVIRLICRVFNKKILDIINNNDKENLRYISKELSDILYQEKYYHPKDFCEKTGQVRKSSEI